MPFASRAHPVAVGAVLGGRYRIDRLIGTGGMGAVYAATHLELGEAVAIKTLLRRHKDKETVERFLREARAMFRLKGEHVARVHDVGKLDDGSPFIVLEYLEGETLGDLIARKGVLDAKEAVAILQQILVGMVEVHALGIVHRDLKPANVFLSRRTDGSLLVKVMDFGIAKTYQDDETTRLTGDGTMMGTVPYMSPEQVRSTRDVDVRSDVWSLGAVAYAMLTGRPPIDGATQVLQLAAHLNGDAIPHPTERKSGVPRPLGDAVMHCLTRDPSARPTLADLAGELSAAMSPPVEVPPVTAHPVTTSVGPSPERAPNRRSAWVVLALALVAVATTFGAAAILRAPPASVSPSAAPPTMTPTPAPTLAPTPAPTPTPTPTAAPTPTSTELAAPASSASPSRQGARSTQRPPKPAPDPGTDRNW